MELTFTRPGQQTNPWDTAQQPLTYTLVSLDFGIRNIYVDGTATESTSRTSSVRRVRSIMVDATGTVPAIGDRVTLNGRVHDVLEVKPLAPAGANLYFKLEVSS